MEKSTVSSVRVTRNRSFSGTGPKLSLVVPCYNVDTYLPVLLRSLDSQEGDPSDLEYIFVIDGSPDDSERIIQEWMETSRVDVVLVVQPNSGVSGALNTGTVLARGEWVSYSGPDDELSSEYFSEILLAIKANPSLDLFVTRLIRVKSNGWPTTHPLDFKFAGLEDNRLVSLEAEPEMIHLHAGMAAFRRSRIVREELRFDEELRKGFEDAHFIARFLLTMEHPRYVIVAKANYFYLAREDSLTSVPDYTKYRGIIATAYMDLLSRTESGCPQWLANLILYDLWWLFRQYLNMKSAVFSMSDADQAELDTLSRDVLVKVGLENVRRFRVVNLPIDVRAAWENAAQMNGESHVAILRRHDSIRGLQKVVFHSSDPRANARIRLDGRALSVPYKKSRSIPFFGRTWMYEHIYWVNVKDLEDRLEDLTIEGMSESLVFLFEGRVLTARRAGRLLNKVAPTTERTDHPLPAGTTAESPRARRRRYRKQRRALKMERVSYALAYRIGGLIGWRRAFQAAWVLVDRNTQANDNAEALYRHLKDDRRDINAWFVIDKGSPDFKRLRADGFKVVPYGSKRHFCLMKEAHVLASSMVDQYVLQPFPKRYLPKTWTYSFLQHGVTKDLVHRWWNWKTIDHLVTATEPEYESIVSDGSPYVLSQKEVSLTGMPRHDRLYELSESPKTRQKNFRRVLIMPTWRNYLAGKTSGAKNQLVEGFYETSFVKNWSGFLNGKAIGELASTKDVDVVLLPHPGIDDHWSDLQLPPGVRRASYLGDDVQLLVAQSDVVITDYSSQAFEGAFCGVPSIYFQFDRAEFFAGGHIGSQGYFDYFRDGFGPVVESIDEVDEALLAILDRTHPEMATYEERISSLYAHRDSKNSARVVAEIEKRMRPVSE